MKNLFERSFQILNGAMVSLALLGVYSCKKHDNTTTSAPAQQQAIVISCNGAPSNISGIFTKNDTLCAGNTYNVTGDVTIPKGVSLYIQPGVTVNFPSSTPYSFIVQGNLFSIGTAAAPIKFTVSSLTKTDGTVTDPFSDPAYLGSWTGILGDTTCEYMILKYTHVEFGGAIIATSPVFGLTNGGNAYPISFVNPKGTFVLEDSWVYGSFDDAIRVQGGVMHVMRNTFEKCGYTGGECINIKSGTIGNVAYNLFIGSATNGPKPSDQGTNNPATNVSVYNNTIVNCGYRRSSLGRGGSINYEDNGAGSCYNNIIVNCKYGFRVVSNGVFGGKTLIIADTAHMHYGNNLNYNDSLSNADQIYPVACLTKPQPTDIPNPASFLPSGYTLGSVYSAPDSILQKNNPVFKNFPLPQPTIYPTFQSLSWAKGFDFHLQIGSAAIGKGFTGFDHTTAFTAATTLSGKTVSPIPIDPIKGVTKYNEPNMDLGAFPTDGSGNQQTY